MPEEHAGDRHGCWWLHAQHCQGVWDCLLALATLSICSCRESASVHPATRRPHILLAFERGQCTVLLKDIETFGEMNEVYAKWFGGEGVKPARAAFGQAHFVTAPACLCLLDLIKRSLYVAAVDALPKEALVEIESIAVLP